MDQPMQPVLTDDKGIVRFQGNAIIQHMFEKGQFDLNDLCANFSIEDYEQLLQLLNFSVSGYGDMPVRKSSVLQADNLAAAEQIEDASRPDELKAAHRSLIAAFKTPSAVEPVVVENSKSTFLTASVKQRISRAERLAIKTTF